MLDAKNKTAAYIMRKIPIGSASCTKLTPEGRYIPLTPEKLLTFECETSGFGTFDPKTEDIKEALDFQFGDKLIIGDKAEEEAELILECLTQQEPRFVKCHLDKRECHLDVRLSPDAIKVKTEEKGSSYQCRSFVVVTNPIDLVKAIAAIMEFNLIPNESDANSFKKNMGILEQNIYQCLLKRKEKLQAEKEEYDRKNKSFPDQELLDACSQVMAFEETYLLYKDIKSKNEYYTTMKATLEETDHYKATLDHKELSEKQRERQLLAIEGNELLLKKLFLETKKTMSAREPLADVLRGHYKQYRAYAPPQFIVEFKKGA